MKNKILIYFPYEVKTATTGSSVRPNKIIDTFNLFAERNDLEIIVLSGNTKERKAKFKNLINNKTLDSVLYCYMENKTLPIWLTDPDKIPRNLFFENNFLKNLEKRNIPIGIFYRDVYWKFPEYYPITGLKLKIMKSIYQKELALYDKFASIIYLPSLSMNRYSNFKTKTSALPPGIDEYKDIKKYNKKNIIYVGSLNENSGIDDIVKLVDVINENTLNYSLTIVCPKENKKSQQNIFTYLESFDFVRIKHLFGEDLANEYSNASLSIIPRKVNEYNSFAMPIKLFEYLQYNLPIISSDVTETKKFLLENNVGVIYRNIEDICKILLDFEDEEFYLKYITNIKKTSYENKWYNRVEKINSDLLGE